MRLPRGLYPLLAEIRITIRHIIGVSLRKISDLLLYDLETPSKVNTQPEVTVDTAPAEAGPPPTRVRDRSGYDPMNHGAVPSALYGALTILRRHGHETCLTVNQILEEIEATDSTLRKGLKVMEEKGVMGHRGAPAEFYILDEEKATAYLQEFEERGVPLFLKDPREENLGLH